MYLHFIIYTLFARSSGLYLRNLPPPSPSQRIISALSLDHLYNLITIKNNSYDFNNFYFFNCYLTLFLGNYYKRFLAFIL
jgi:hypothetical protein